MAEEPTDGPHRPDRVSTRSGRWLLAGVVGLVVATAAVVVWNLNRGEPATRLGGDSRPETTRVADWTLEPLPVKDACGSAATGFIRAVLLPAKQGPLPFRLSDHMLDASPIGLYDLNVDGPVVDVPPLVLG